MSRTTEAGAAGGTSGDAAPGTPLDWKAPADAPAPVPAGSLHVTREVSSGWRVAAIIGLLVAALLAVAIVFLWQQVDDLSQETTQTRARVTDARGIAASVEALEQSVDELKGSVGNLTESTSASTANVTTQLAAFQARTDALVVCVNTYMDAIGQWTRSITGSFVYSKC